MPGDLVWCTTWPCGSHSLLRHQSTRCTSQVLEITSRRRLPLSASAGKCLQRCATICQSRSFRFHLTTSVHSTTAHFTYRTMSFHKKATLDIQVDFWRFERIKKWFCHESQIGMLLLNRINRLQAEEKRLSSHWQEDVQCTSRFVEPFLCCTLRPEDRYISPLVLRFSQRHWGRLLLNNDNNSTSNPKILRTPFH